MGAVRLLRHHEGPRSPVHAGAGVALVVAWARRDATCACTLRCPSRLLGFSEAWAQPGPGVFLKLDSVGGRSGFSVWLDSELEVGLQVWAVSGVKFTSCEVSGVLWASRRCKPSRLRFNTNMPRECNNHQEGVCWVQVCSRSFSYYSPT